MIRLERVTLGYNGRPVLRDIDLVIGRGITLVTGENGSGKTTLCKAVSGLLPPISGRILVRGRDIYREDVEKPVYIHDKPVILRRSVLENIAYGLRIRGESLDRAVEIAREFGLEDILHEPAWKLSSGYQKLVSILRGIAVEPDILVLDEPLNHLDRRFRKKILDHLSENYREKTLIIASHREELKNIAHTTLEIIDGMIK